MATKQNIGIIAAMVLGAVGIVLALIGLGSPAPAAETGTFGAQAANTRCYFALGGSTFVAGRGCTINAQSGSALTVDGGAVFTADTLTVTNLISSVVDFVGSTATITTVNVSGDAVVGGNLTVTGTSTFGNVMTVNGNGDFDSLSVAGNTDLTTINNTGANPVTVNDNLVVTGTVSPAGFIIHSSASITPTDGGTLTPSADFVTLTPAGALGTAMAACTTGEGTVLYNSVNANVVITDTGNFLGAGNQTLGQYDTLQMACIDSKWVQVGAVSAN